jgi:hypothetical protein
MRRNRPLNEGRNEFQKKPRIGHKETIFRTRRARCLELFPEAAYEILYGVISIVQHTLHTTMDVDESRPEGLHGSSVDAYQWRRINGGVVLLLPSTKSLGQTESCKRSLEVWTLAAPANTTSAA